MRSLGRGREPVNGARVSSVTGAQVLSCGRRAAALEVFGPRSPQAAPRGCRGASGGRREPTMPRPVRPPEYFGTPGLARANFHSSLVSFAIATLFLRA